MPVLGQFLPAYAIRGDLGRVTLRNALDAIMVDGPLIDYVIRTTGELEAVGQIDSKPLAIGVLKDSPMFPLLRETFIDLMKQGIYQKIMNNWGLGANTVSDPIINDPEG
jgi:ABC-type amino acid transport substrate-binding protein